MTITEAVDYCRDMHNASGDNHWSDLSIYKLLEAKSNECVLITGLIESTSTVSTVVGTESYAFSLFSSAVQLIRRLTYAGVPLKRITQRQYEQRTPSGVVPSGTPREYYVWNNTIYLTPNPSAVGTLKAWTENKQSAITTSSSTLDVPVIFHSAICDGAIFMMYAKDLNMPFMQQFRQIWLEHREEMKKFARKRRRSDGYNVVQDSDSALETDFGVV